MTTVARPAVALAVALVVLAAGLCLMDAAGQHADGMAICCAIVATLVVTVAIALGASGRSLPLAGIALPGLSPELVAPPPRA